MRVPAVRLNPRRLAGGVSSGVLLLGALSVGLAIDKSSDDGGRATRAFVRTAELGQETVTGYAKITALSVDGGRRLVELRTPQATPGLWVVATVRWESVGEPEYPGRVSILAPDGTTYVHAALGGCPGSNPGIPVICRFQFEVDPDDLPGAIVEIAATDFDDRWTEIVHIDPAITTQMVQTWRDRDELPLAPAEPAAPMRTLR